MADEELVRYGDNAGDTATLLLGSAEKLGLDPSVVRHQPDDSGFRVPAEVAKDAGLKAADTEAEAAAEEEERRTALEEAISNEQGVAPVSEQDSKSTAKKSTAKKSAKKSTTKKSASKSK